MGQHQVNVGNIRNKKEILAILDRVALELRRRGNTGGLKGTAGEDGSGPSICRYYIET